MIDSDMRLYEIVSRAGIIRLHGSHQAAMAKAKRLAEATGRAVQVRDEASGAKWIALSGPSTPVGAWSGTARAQRAYEATRREIRNIVAVHAQFEAKPRRAA